jgi:hypothetical protein
MTELPDPSEHENVRRWKVLHEFASAVAHSPLLERAAINFRDGTWLEFKDREMRVGRTARKGDVMRPADVSLTLDQVPGYIAALEGDVLSAQQEVQASGSP